MALDQECLQKMVRKFLPVEEQRVEKDLPCLLGENKSSSSHFVRTKNKFRSLESKEFLFLKEKGKTFRTRDFLFVYFIEKNLKEGRKDFAIGLSLSRKVGKAVLRNRLKRFFRESFRHIWMTEVHGSLKFSQGVSFLVHVIPLKSSKDKFPRMNYSHVFNQVKKFFFRIA